MPNFPSATFCVPKSWDEFEEMCLSAVMQRWPQTVFSRNGRSGQQQLGVDIYGRTPACDYVGIQCKNTVGGISIKVVNNEVSAAESFRPALRELLIATSAPPDASIQKYARELSVEREKEGLFVVDLMFWPDITRELTKNPSELRRFYGDFFFGSSEPRRLSPRDQDVTCLAELLGGFDVESIPHYLCLAPKAIHSRFLDELDQVRIVWGGPLFQLHDTELRNAIDALIGRWGLVVQRMSSAPYEYNPLSERLMWVLRMDVFQSPEEEFLFDGIHEGVKDFLESLERLCELVHRKYPELDIRATSAAARARFRSAL